MRGVILAGGLGTRLEPLTKIANKHLLPIFNRPMIFYPIETLVRAGIKEIMIIVSGPHVGNFIPLLKNGEDFGLDKLEYGYQSKPDGGIADALQIAESFVGKEPVIVILGDNVSDADLKADVEYFKDQVGKLNNGGLPVAKVFLKEVDDPERFGVATVVDNRITEVVEKPTNPKSNLAVTGVYFYDYHVFDFIRKCAPSARGQLEITDVNNMYINHGNLSWTKLNGHWQDCGTFETLFSANKYWHDKFNS